MRGIAEAATVLGLIAVCGLVLSASLSSLQKGESLLLHLRTVAKPADHEQPSSGLATARHPMPSPPISNSSRPRTIEALKRIDFPRSQQTVYKWVDEKGTVHFSDRATSANAKAIASRPVPTYDHPESVKTEQLATRYASPSSAIPAAYPSGKTVQVGKGRFLTSQGYEVTAKASHVGSKLSLKGRVEGGPGCGTLEITGLLSNNAGRSVRLVGYARDVGRGGRIFESNSVGTSPNLEGWEVVGISAYCR